MQKRVLSIAVAAVLGAGGLGATAAPISLSPGPLFFQFNNLEQVSVFGSLDPITTIDVDGDGIDDTPATENNWGVFNISSLQNGGISDPAGLRNNITGGPVFWSDDGVGGTEGQITGIFYGLAAAPATPPAIASTLGWIDIWWTDAGSDTVTAADLTGTGAVTPAIRTGANEAGKFTGDLNGDGTNGDAGTTFLGRLAFDSGIIQGDTTTHISGSATPNGLGSFIGFAASYASVIDTNDDGVIDALDGAWAALFNGDFFRVDDDFDGTFGNDPGETRDFRFDNIYRTQNAWDGLAGDNTPIFGLTSNDPGRVFITVPEPASLALAGLGLLAAGFAKRRKKS